MDACLLSPRPVLPPAPRGSPPADTTPVAHASRRTVVWWSLALFGRVVLAVARGERDDEWEEG